MSQSIHSEPRQPKRRTDDIVSQLDLIQGAVHLHCITHHLSEQTPVKALRADRDAFSLNAEVSCQPYQRDHLERL